MSRSVTRGGDFTKVTTLGDDDTILAWPKSGDIVKGITKQNLEKQFEGDGNTPQQIIDVTTTFQALFTNDVLICDGTFTVSLASLSVAIKQLTIRATLGSTITVVSSGSDPLESGVSPVTSGTAQTIVPTTGDGWLKI